MRLMGGLPGQNGDADADPRESEDIDDRDLATRNTLPIVAQRGGSDGLGLAAGALGVALLGFAAFWGMNSTRTGTDDVVAVETAPVPVAAVPIDQIPIQPPVGGGTAAPQPAEAQVVRGDPAPQPVYSVNPGFSPTPQGNTNSSPTVIFDISGTPVGSVAVPAAAITGTDTSDGAVGTGSAADFASRVGGVGGGPARAQPMTDPSNTLTQGTLIPAILETAINTDVPGYVRAIVSQDVRSFDGTRVLVPRSSRLIGQYQSGVQNGQKRAYVIWNRLIRPDGASVSLQSPAVGFDGTTGLAGKVDSRFFKRFGSAILLSVIDGLATVASGGAGVVLGGGSNAAGQALQQDGQIGPTIRVGSGTPTRVFAARDLDFSQVQ